MNMIVRGLVALLLLAALIPEFARHRAEWQLADARDALMRVLGGLDRNSDALAQLQRADRNGREAAHTLGADARAPLVVAIANIALQRGDVAMDVLDAAIEQAERPELVVNLGRALFQQGDATAADAAYLRATWASAAAIQTLPRSMRDALTTQVSELESDLAKGKLEQPPPLPTR